MGAKLTMALLFWGVWEMVIVMEKNASESQVDHVFFVDFAGHGEEEKVRKCLTDMVKFTIFVKVLGSYPRGGEP